MPLAGGLWAGRFLFAPSTGLPGSVPMPLRGKRLNWQAAGRQITFGSMVAAL